VIDSGVVMVIDVLFFLKHRKISYDEIDPKSVPEHKVLVWNFPKQLKEELWNEEIVL